ncbi:B12-binding domain-containing protein [Tropicimonas sp. IMCC34043]|uniref:cobalamin B12-binding domain-containing protein n=1 Tax=Tropicimonas sp. IMCC34043 TaxID=2248760 RepID=UPI000E23B963|nr:cobalamin-dependent protein [Tropicimonas sp. IMCC34043]
MKSDNASSRSTQCTPSRAEIRQLAELALDIVAHKAGPPPRETEESRVRDLCNSMLHHSRCYQQIVLSRLAASGIGAAEIFERYLPAVADMLGERWVRDEITFVDVTHASIRLQEVVRHYGRQYAGEDLRLSCGQAVLMCVPRFEQHSLGAFMAANQLRRLGLVVQMGIGFSENEIIESMKHHNFSMIGLSASSQKSVAPLCRLVNNLRRSLPESVPIIIGGKVVNCGVDIQQVTGADMATIDVQDAAKRCGMLGGQETARTRSFERAESGHKPGR